MAGSPRSLTDGAAVGQPAGDQIVVTKLDRLGRSLEHLIELSQHLQAKGVDLMVLDQGRFCSIESLLAGWHNWPTEALSQQCTLFSLAPSFAHRPE
jgi:hypothetical protein